MSGDEQPNVLNFNPSSQIPQTFADTIEHLTAIVLDRFVQEAAEKQLFYHNQDHVRDVQRRSQQIFALISPTLDAEVDRERTQSLLDFCAIAHDLVQQFDPNSLPHTTRQRQPGVSERMTIEQLMRLIHQHNQQTSNRAAQLTETDIAVIQQAITATICTYNLQEQAIYQPLLYSGEPLSIVSRILALADLGTLGIDGIEVYNREGSLLFLEENPDVVSLVQSGEIYQLEETDPTLAENIRQRLLKRCRFQINFAKSRLSHLEQELQGFPAAIHPVLLTKIFRHLSPATIQTLEAITPTEPDTPLNVLLKFFQFEKYVPRSTE